MATLYVVTQGAVVGVRQNTIIVTFKRKPLINYPISNIDRIILMGRIQVTAYAVNFFLRRGIEVFFLSRLGKFRGFITPGFSSSTSARKAQYYLSEDQDSALSLASRFVAGKLENSEWVIRKLAGRKSGKNIAGAIRIIRRSLDNIYLAGDLDSLRGFEGASARAYYGALSRLATKPFEFKGRNRRPPRDPVNALMSLGYTFLLNVIHSIVLTRGLDPYVGFLHSDKKGAPALALDLMEEWRPLIDFIIFSALKKKEFSLDDFSRNKKGVFLSKAGLATYTTMFEDLLMSRTIYPPSKEMIKHIQCMEMQVVQLKQSITGKIRKYVPFSIARSYKEE